MRTRPARSNRLVQAALRAPVHEMETSQGSRKRKKKKSPQTWVIACAAAIAANAASTSRDSGAVALGIAGTAKPSASTRVATVGALELSATPADVADAGVAVVALWSMSLTSLMPSARPSTWRKYPSAARKKKKKEKEKSRLQIDGQQQHQTLTTKTHTNIQTRDHLTGTHIQAPTRPHIDCKPTIHVICQRTRCHFVASGLNEPENLLESGLRAASHPTHIRLIMARADREGGHRENNNNNNKINKKEEDWKPPSALPTESFDHASRTSVTGRWSRVPA